MLLEEVALVDVVLASLAFCMLISRVSFRRYVFWTLSGNVADVDDSGSDDVDADVNDDVAAPVLVLVLPLPLIIPSRHSDS